MAKTELYSHDPDQQGFNTRDLTAATYTVPVQWFNGFVVGLVCLQKQADGKQKHSFAKTHTEIHKVQGSRVQCF